jgi:hypothetical protein
VLFDIHQVVWIHKGLLVDPGSGQQALRGQLPFLNQFKIFTDFGCAYQGGFLFVLFCTLSVLICTTK